MMVDRDKVLATLREKRDDIERRYGMRMIGITGSLARGEAAENSEIDIMVDIIRTPSLFEISRAERDLEGADGIGAPVELVLREALRPTIRAHMERDLIPL